MESIDKTQQNAITARRILADKGLDASSFNFPIAITFHFKGMADLGWWRSHSSRFGAKRINHPEADDSDSHWGKIINSCPISIWNIEANGTPIIFVGPTQFGNPTAIALEELKVLGLKYVIGIGAAGAFDERLKIGDIVIADRAIVSDGTSKAYTDESIAYPSAEMQSLAEDVFRRHKIPINHTCVWQSDAIYRESLEARAEWRSQGAECVNCETSTLYTVSKELGIKAVYLAWISDSTCSGKWTGWGKGIWTPSQDGKPAQALQPTSSLVMMEDIAIDIANEIKRRELV